MYSVLAFSHHYKIHPEHVSKYIRYIDQLNVDGLDFSMQISQIPVFEANNPDYSINVIYPDSDDKTFIPRYASKYRSRKYIVNLLELNDDQVRHYTVIRDLFRLLSARNSYKFKTFPCPYCLSFFWAENLLNSHYASVQVPWTSGREVSTTRKEHAGI